MGWTSEMLALQYNISRAQQDQLGHLSHSRASFAQDHGRFDNEIMPVTTSVFADSLDPSQGRLELTVDKDDGIRHGLKSEDMARARSAFKGMGEERSTGLNSSQMTDGAAMLVMMRRSKAEELRLEVLATHVATSVVGVTPRVMGHGPVMAIPYVPQRSGTLTRGGRCSSARE